MGRGGFRKPDLKNIRCSEKKKNSFSGNSEMNVRKIDRTGNVRFKVVTAVTMM